MDKKECRNYLKNQWNSVNTASLERLNHAIFRNITASKAWKGCDIILAYLSFSGEISLDNLIIESLINGKKVFVPRIKKPGLMDFHRIDNLKPDSLELNRGIREPLEKSEIFIDTPYRGEQLSGITPPKLLILTPGLGFTQDGRRMGRGGGYYDRFLNGIIETDYCVTMGIAWTGIIIPEIPSESHDRKVRKLCSESDIIHCQPLN